MNKNLRLLHITEVSLSLPLYFSAYEYVADTEEASDSVASSYEAMSPQVVDDRSERAQMLKEMQEMQDRIHAVFSGEYSNYNTEYWN